MPVRLGPFYVAHTIRFIPSIAAPKPHCGAITSCLQGLSAALLQ